MLRTLRVASSGQVARARCRNNPRFHHDLLVRRERVGCVDGKGVIENDRSGKLTCHQMTLGEQRRKALELLAPPLGRSIQMEKQLIEEISDGVATLPFNRA